MRVAALVGLLLVLLFAGCASVPPATQGEQPEGGTPHGGVVNVPPMTQGEQPQGGAPGGVIGGPPADGTATPSTGGSTDKTAPKVAPSAAKIRANIPVSPAVSRASASQVPKKDSIAPELAKQIASPPFDLTSLEQRLKETHAIGVLAKIALRNQVDDLLSQFRAFHNGKVNTTLVELRRPYDLLVLKVLWLLRDNDPSLAAALVASREALWGILSDPAKFATI
ncbi:MAG TPA: hypothetical protein VGK75_02380 [Casimicrobiaceae bacterium]|jgi:hypothetical protein